MRFLVGNYRLKIKLFGKNMFNKAIVLILLIFSLNASTATAQQTCPGLPVISGWKQVSIATIDKSHENGTIAYLGYETEYQNPNNTNEYVIVAARFVAIASLSPIVLNYMPYIEVVGNYIEAEVNKELSGLINKHSDIFLYIYRKIRLDDQNGQLTLDGPAQYWLLGSDGDCAYASGTKVSIKDITEPNKNNQEQFIIVGKMYSLNGVRQVLRIDQDYFIPEKRK